MGTPSEAMFLRLAVQNLANAAQAQRRYVQMGMMPFAIANLDRLGADPRSIEGGEAFTDEALDLVAQLRDEVAAQMAAHADFLERADSEPREFLFSDALENDDWERVRQLARRCHHLLAGKESAFIALMAK